MLAVIITKQVKDTRIKTICQSKGGQTPLQFAEWGGNCPPPPPAPLVSYGPDIAAPSNPEFRYSNCSNGALHLADVSNDFPKQ